MLFSSFLSLTWFSHLRPTPVRYHLPKEHKNPSLLMVFTDLRRSSASTMSAATFFASSCMGKWLPYYQRCIDKSRSYTGYVYVAYAFYVCQLAEALKIMACKNRLEAEYAGAGPSPFIIAYGTDDAIWPSISAFDSKYQNVSPTRPCHAETVCIYGFLAPCPLQTLCL